MLDNIHTIYFNGCSYTEGGGFESKKESVKKAYKEKYGFEYNSEKDVCYPTIVQKLLPHINIINEAKSGAGADRIIRKAWEYIEKSKLEDLKKTIFILEIPSSISRLDIYSNKHNRYLVANVDYDYKTTKVNDVHIITNWIYGPNLDVEYTNKTKEIIKDYSNYFINPIEYDTNLTRSFFGLFKFFIENNIEFYVSGELYYFKYNKLFNNYFSEFIENNILNVNINGNIYQNIITYCLDTKGSIQNEVGKDISYDNHPGYKVHISWGEAIVNFLKEPKQYKPKFI